MIVKRLCVDFVSLDDLFFKGISCNGNLKRVQVSAKMTDYIIHNTD